MKHTNQLMAAFIATVVMVSSAMAQAPQKMSYQSVIRNASGALVTNQAVGVKISLLQGSATGTAVYVETQNPTTNANGLASFQIGAGTVVSGSFASINWAAGPYFVKTETDPTGGSNYSIAGTTQLLSVAYALYAANSGTQGAKGDSGVSIRNTKVNGDSLFVTLSDGQTLNAGNVRGAKGVTIDSLNISLDSLITYKSDGTIVKSNYNKPLGIKIGFSNTTTWTCPPGITQITVELWGGAGGGGASSAYGVRFYNQSGNGGMCGSSFVYCFTSFDIIGSHSSANDIFLAGCGGYSNDIDFSPIYGGAGGNGGSGGYIKKTVTVVPGLT